MLQYYIDCNRAVLKYTEITTIYDKIIAYRDTITADTPGLKDLYELKPLNINNFIDNIIDYKNIIDTIKVPMISNFFINFIDIILHERLCNLDFIILK